MHRVEEIGVRESQVVTGVVADPRAPGYEILELNGTRFASLPAHLVSGAGLVGGHSVNPETFELLSEAADVEAACRVAVRLLATRPRCEFEMRRSLRDRGHRAAAIDGAIERLIRRKLIDDAEYARHFARVRTGKGHGRPRIIADLRVKGVNGRLAERIVAEILEEEEFDTLAKARQLAEKRLSQLAHLPLPARRRRVLAFLYRRGYQGWEVRDIVHELIDQD